MKTAVGLRCAALLLAAAAIGRADPPPRESPRPDRIRYDRACLTIDGKDKFIFSFSFDYFRCPKPLWRDRFRKIKEAGGNAVATEVPPDVAALSARADLRDWLRLAEDEFGLYTIVRPGPSLSAVGPVLAAEQVTRQPRGRPGVILVPIEDGSNLSPDGSEAARADGIEVPLFAPVTVSGPTAALRNARALLAIQEGATVLDYAMPWDGTDADFRAAQALGRMLQVHGAALARSRSLICQDEAESPDVTVAARRSQDGAIYVFFGNRSPDGPRRGSAVVWIEAFGDHRIDYDLGPLGAKVLYLPRGVTDVSGGQWLPR